MSGIFIDFLFLSVFNVSDSLVRQRNDCSARIAYQILYMIYISIIGGSKTYFLSLLYGKYGKLKVAWIGKFFWSQQPYYYRGATYLFWLEDYVCPGLNSSVPGATRLVLEDKFKELCDLDNNYKINAKLNSNRISCWGFGWALQKFNITFVLCFVSPFYLFQRNILFKEKEMWI